MRWLPTLSLLSLLLSLGISAEAFAQEKETAARAKDHYERGARLYEVGQYREAAEELREAYILVPRPMLLYNIAMAEWRSGQLDRALDTAERALEKDLPGTMMPRTKARVAGFRQTLTAQRIAEDVKNVHHAAVVPPADDEPVAAEDGGWLGPLGWVGATLTAVGTGSIVGAVVVDRQLAEDAEAFEAAAAGGDEDAYDTQLADLEERQTIGRVLLASGGLLAAGGITLLAIDLGGDDAEAEPTTSQFRLKGTPRPGGATAGIELLF